MASLNSYTQIGRREDLTDKLIQLGDSQAKLLSSFKLRGTTHTMLTEWQDYTLPTPTQNSQVQGFTVTGQYTTRNRRNNYVQIFSSPFQVDDTTIENMTVAGVKDELKFQSDIYLLALKRDIEWALINNSSSTTGASATANASGLMLGMFGAVTTNTYAPAASSSVFTEDELITALRGIVDNTGVATNNLELHTGSLNIDRITKFSEVNKSMVVSPGQNVHDRAVYTLKTNFGNLDLVTNIMVGNSKIGIFNFDSWAYVEKVAPKLKEIGKDGDSTTMYWKTEATIHWLSERSNAVMTGIATS